MDSFVRAVRAVSQLCGFVAAGLIASGVLVVCHMVFVRYVLNQNTIWQTDFTTYCLIAATFVGSPFVLMTRGHVNVDVLPHYLGPRARFWLALFAAAISLAFAVSLAVLTFDFWEVAWGQHWVSDTTWRARLWVPYSFMTIALGLLFLHCVADVSNLVPRRHP